MEIEKNKPFEMPDFCEVDGELWFFDTEEMTEDEMEVEYQRQYDLFKEDKSSR